MFETAEIGNRVDKRTFKREAPVVREQLLDMQRRLAASRLSAVILVGGVEGAGKSETVNLLHEWMDARGLQTNAMWDLSDEERDRPPMWRFWRVLPPAGKIGVFFGSWYTAPIIDRVFERVSQDTLDRQLSRIVEFEQMLTNENVVVLKFWMHLSKAAQKARMKALSKDPDTAWRVTKREWKFLKSYDTFRTVSEHALRNTSTGTAPWHVVEASDDHYRSLTVTRKILDAVNERLDAAASVKKPLPKAKPAAPAKVNILSRMDLSKRLTKKTYEKQLLKAQAELALLTRDLHARRRSVICVFEGSDAAGKGGAIRRLTHAMDARNYQVISVAAPTDEERARPYLWRFWRHLPRLGKVTIYDRSWYGRVLVERVENFARPEDWKRAYSEINEFEEQLTDFGIILVKFWLQISPQEQLRRFREREQVKFKNYKITEEDWRNRAKAGAYVSAAVDMVDRTSTEHAPWVLVESEDKHFARVKVVKTVVGQLEKHL